VTLSVWARLRAGASGEVTESQPSGPCEGLVARSTAPVARRCQRGGASSIRRPTSIPSAAWTASGRQPPCGRRKSGAVWGLLLQQRQDKLQSKPRHRTALQTPIGDSLNEGLYPDE